MESSAHRKIELQSPDDLRYLIINVTRAAQAKLDTHFPPDAEHSPSTNTTTTTTSSARLKAETLIQAVLSLLSTHTRTRTNPVSHLQYIHRTFTHALPSLSINGLDATDMHTSSSSLIDSFLLLPKQQTAVDEAQEQEQYEAYDHQLAARVQTLYATLEAETLALAQLRREMPVRAAREWCERFEREVEREDQRWEEEEEEEEEEGTGLDLHALRMQRERDVRDTWGRGLEGLSALKTTLPGTVAKLERAKTAVDYVESMESR